MKLRFYLNGQQQRADEVDEARGLRLIENAFKEWNATLGSGAVNSATSIQRPSARELVVETNEQSTLRWMLK